MLSMTVLRRQPPLLAALALAFLAGLACGGGGAGEEALQGATIDVEFPPDVVFDASEWTTLADYPAIGDPQARREQQDRAFVIPWPTFPPTLRTDGPNSNLTTLATVHGLVYETLVTIHPETEEFIPLLASHWRIDVDEAAQTQTFWFRIDEDARWADGTPVTAADVYYSWWHKVQEDRNDPSSYITFTEGYEEPEIVDRRTIKVRTKSLNWRLFLYFGAGMLIFPAEEIAVPGEVYLREYNWRLVTGSGPYELASPGDLRKGESLVLTRRRDWWAEDEPWARNTYNFGKVRWIVIRDPELEYEKFKRGDLDWYQVRRAQRWVEELPQEAILRKGWVKRRKIYNQAPQGFAGLAFNMRHPPFDDRRVRLAFAHLFNRERLNERLFFNEYELINSIYPGRDWGAGDENPVIHFDPDRAAALLAEAGYRRRDRGGYLVDGEGNRLEVTLQYGDPGFERVWLVVKEDYETAGVKFDLELIDASTLIKKISERQFRIHFQAWGALLFPNPETSWRSDLADQPANNNIVGFENERVDELLDRYNRVFERQEQKAITREIDRIVYAEAPYAFAWYARYHRILYWDRFGHPASYLTRIGQIPEDSMLLLWWWDAEKEAALEKARAAGESLPQGEVVVRPWAGAT